MINDSLTSVFGRLRERLRGRAARILLSDHDSDDALQEAFVRLWERRDRLDGVANLEGVADVTVRNVCIDMLRQRRHMLPSDQLPDVADDDDDAVSRETARQVGQLIDNSLSERDRRILIMRDRNGYDYDEIAAEMGMSQTAVRMALSRARHKIRELYRTQNH